MVTEKTQYHHFATGLRILRNWNFTEAWIIQIIHAGIGEH